MSDSKIKKTIIDNHLLSETDDDGNLTHPAPSKYYIINALGQAVFYHCRNRDDAQRESDKEYGINKYKIKASRQSGKSGGEYSATGSNTRRGFSSRLKGIK